MNPKSSAALLVLCMLNTTISDNSEYNIKHEVKPITKPNARLLRQLEQQRKKPKK